jgi:hypothetical protein
VKGMRTSGKQSIRSRGQAESPSPDLSSRHHLSDGFQRSSSESSAAAAWRRSRQGSARGETTRVSEREVRLVGLTEPLVGFDQKA